MKTCIYLRKSRKGDDQNETVAETLRRHREQLLAIAKKMDLLVIDIKEEVVSGDSIASRPMMQELLDEVEDEKYDAVLVMDIDRLGRGNMIDQGIISKAFKESNTLVITPDKTYDLSDDLDEDFYDLYAFFARKELKQIKKRLQRGKIKSIKEGNFVWSKAPYGYLKTGRTEIVPHPQNARIIKDIFAWYLLGMSMGKIADMLNEAGIPTNNNCQWSHKNISAILRNNEYTGDVVYGKTKLVKGRPSRQPKENWLIVQGKHEALISHEDFNKVQSMLTTMEIPHIKWNSQLFNPLSGVLVCGRCGSAMTRKTYKGGADRIKCNQACPGTKSALLNSVEERYIEILTCSLYARLQEIGYINEQNPKDKSAPLQAQKKNLEQRLSKIKVQVNNQYDLLEQGVYNLETFRERSNAVAAEREEIEQKIAALDEQIKSMKKAGDLASLRPELESAIDFIENVYWTTDVKTKNDFLKSVVAHAEYFRSKTDSNADFSISVMIRF